MMMEYHNNVSLESVMILSNIVKMFFFPTGGFGPQIFLDVDNPNFIAGSTHSVKITLNTEEGQSASDTVQFVAVEVPDTPSRL